MEALLKFDKSSSIFCIAMTKMVLLCICSFREAASVRNSFYAKGDVHCVLMHIIVRSSLGVSGGAVLLRVLTVEKEKGIIFFAFSHSSTFYNGN